MNKRTDPAFRRAVTEQLHGWGEEDWINTNTFNRPGGKTGKYAYQVKLTTYVSLRQVLVEGTPRRHKQHILTILRSVYFSFYFIRESMRIRYSPQHFGRLTAAPQSTACL